ncbi:E3 ubiquitin-protein ligase TRIM21-like isoform X1 [Chanodichthys erythropterus]|uniref:E3 ubiquitin-protein ligase TRIM21-like isoform X1 n=1 Tax=Chanodichthys erythropterus TaxID=933992 RepID=UPI00351E9DDE
MCDVLHLVCVFCVFVCRVMRNEHLCKHFLKTNVYDILCDFLILNKLKQHSSLSGHVFCQAHEMDSINENTDFVLSKVSSDEKYSEFKGNFTEELESERKVNPSKGTKALLILLGLMLVFALGGLCIVWMLYNNKHADFESLKEQHIMVSKQLAAQMINSTVMIREQDELRTNYTRVKEQLQLLDVMIREQDELRTNYTRVKEQLQLLDVMKREQDELRTNYTRVKEQLQLHSSILQKGMKREDELRTNYTRVKEQLQLHDVLQKGMKREQDELRTNYTRVKEQLQLLDVLQKGMKREQDELRTNYTRVKEQLQLHDVLQKGMIREQDELRTNYTRVKEQLQLHDVLQKVMKREQDELRTNYTRVKEQLQLHDDLKRMQQYAVDVTLNPDTAHPSLILSDDGKQVRLGDKRQKLPDKPERFNTSVCVLGKEGFSSGRFYFEVQVKGKTEWDLGVARESINRKGQIILTPSRGFWTVWLRNENEYAALSDPPVSLSLRVKPQRVGVFVDYEEGLVSFYDVKSSSHIYSYTDQSFTGKLYPYFCPSLNNGGKNSTPLIITPV